MILVTDVNDEAPRFLQEPYTVQIPEVNLAQGRAHAFLPQTLPALWGCPGTESGASHHSLPQGPPLHPPTAILHTCIPHKGMFAYHFPNHNVRLLWKCEIRRKVERRKFPLTLARK